jgi:hypothetical protein
MYCHCQLCGKSYGVIEGIACLFAQYNIHPPPDRGIHPKSIKTVARLSTCLRVKRVATGEEADRIVARLKSQAREQQDVPLIATSTHDVTSDGETTKLGRRNSDPGGEQKMGTADKATGTSPGVAALAGATPFGSAAPTTPLAAGCSTRKGLADIAGLFVVRKRQLVTGRLSDSEASGEVAEAATPGGHVTVKGQGDDVTKTSVESQTKENPFDCLKAEESDFLFTTQVFATSAGGVTVRQTMLRNN